MKRTLATLLTALSVVSLSVVSLATAARAEYPERPITLIVPYDAGGSSDVLGRLMARHLEKKIGVPVVVENRPGAGAIVGLTALSQAKPDGYTIANIGFPTLSSAIIEKKTPYTIEKFIPLINQTSAPAVLVVNSDGPFKTLADFIAHAKAQTAPVPIAVVSRSAGAYYMAVALEKLAGYKASYPPFNGGAPARVAVLGGHVPAAVLVPAEVIESVNAGKMRALAVTGDKRFDALPNVPTFAELGIKFESEAVYGSLVGYLAPAGTPAPVIKKLVEAMEKAATDPEYLAEAKQRNVAVSFMPNSEYSAYLPKAHKELEEVMARVK